MADFFSSPPQKIPWAEALRPQKIDDLTGQESLLNPDGPLRRALMAERLPSMIFWGPPGCGKTTLARLLSCEAGYDFLPVSAVSSGVAELRRLFERAQEIQTQGKKAVLFVDEIHRFNRSQQDSLLPGSESGLFTLIGATTENPGFELNAALLSRCQTHCLKALDEVSLEKLLCRAEKFYELTIPIDKDAREALIAMADGDGRSLLNMAEQLALAGFEEKLDSQRLQEFLAQPVPIYDKNRDQHYNLISALHKSLRGSDCNAALYWLARMLAGGEDALYILRRLVRFASEDIGLAEPDALSHALSARETYRQLGSPEGELAIAQLVIYLATAPKSNSAYKAFKMAMTSARRLGSLAPPAHILNAPTKFMKEMGYGEGYVYDHNTEEGFSGQNYFPDKMARERYYEPGARGFEREIAKRLDYWDRLREKKTKE